MSEYEDMKRQYDAVVARERDTASQLAHAEVVIESQKRSYQAAHDRAADAEHNLKLAEAALRGLRAVVEGQAEDEGLWFAAAHVTEAYIQQELRRLHAAVEKHCAAYDAGRRK